LFVLTRKGNSENKAFNKARFFFDFLLATSSGFLAKGCGDGFHNRAGSRAPASAETSARLGERDQGQMGIQGKRIWIRQRRLFPGSFSLPVSETVCKQNPPGKERKTTMMPHKLILIPLLLACFGLLPNAQATDPESALPNGNTADGVDVLGNLSTGAWNSGFGYKALEAETSGSLNTAVGIRALSKNDGAAGAMANTAVGMMALFSNTGGALNCAFGADALVFNDVGVSNTAAGTQALFMNTGGSGNNAFGQWALASNTTGIDSNAFGYGALFNNTASANNAFGFAALAGNTTGGGNSAFGDFALGSNDNTGAGLADLNTAVGASALASNVDGDSNTAVGALALFNENAVGGFPDGVSNNAVGRQALFFNTTGSFNQAIGVNALFLNDIGSQNVAIGDDVMFNNIVGSFNVAIGQTALSNADSVFNTAVGFNAGQNLTTGGENIYLGDTAGTLDNIGVSPGDEAGVIRIGSVFSGTAACFINGIATNAQVWNGVTVCQVTVNGFGQLGVDCVNPNNPGATPQRQAMNDKVEKLQATVAQQQKQGAQQQKQIETLTAQLREQAAQIQKVSAQLETSKPAPQVVVNTP
jgi:uncharacterized coiled-coil protein SlyX